MDFRTNSWYRLTTAASMTSQLSMAGAPPFIDGRDGIVTFAPSDNNSSTQQWQIFPVNTSTFMLRTKASGPNSYLAAVHNSSLDEHTIPRMYNRSRTESSMLWSILPWGDGTFHFSNIPNGNSCHLDFAGAMGVRMSTNTTQPQPGQAFSFVKVGNIDNSAFSTIATPTPTISTSILASPTPISNIVPSIRITTWISSTSTTVTSSITSSPSTPSSFSSQPQHYKIPASAAMGIGVSIGAFGVIFLTAIGLFAYQQWKRRYSPESLHYRRAKLWKGFIPQHQPLNMSLSTAKSKEVAYVAELPEIATPLAVLGSPLSERRSSAHSWHTEGSSISPFVPYTPTTPPVELPVH